MFKKDKEDKPDEPTELATALGMRKESEMEDNDAMSEAAHELCIASNELAQTIELDRHIPEGDKKKKRLMKNDVAESLQNHKTQQTNCRKTNL